MLSKCRILNDLLSVMLMVLGTYCTLGKFCVPKAKDQCKLYGTCVLNLLCFKLFVLETLFIIDFLIFQPLDKTLMLASVAFNPVRVCLRQLMASETVCKLRAFGG